MSCAKAPVSIFSSENALGRSPPLLKCAGRPQDFSSEKIFIPPVKFLGPNFLNDYIQFSLYIEHTGGASGCLTLWR